MTVDGRAGPTGSGGFKAESGRYHLYVSHACPWANRAMIFRSLKGPAFLAYPNFNVLFEWNQSFTYVLTAAYFATRLEGAAVFDDRNPDTGLSGEQMRSLQQKLQARGHRCHRL